MAELPTLFTTPTHPDEFGVILPPANLRKLDFSGLDRTHAEELLLNISKHIIQMNLMISLQATAS